MEADRGHRGEGQGGTHTTGNHRGGRGDTMGWGGEGGPSSAAPYIYIYEYNLCTLVCLFVCLSVCLSLSLCLSLCLSVCLSVCNFKYTCMHMYMLRYMHMQKYRSRYMHRYVPMCMHACMHACACLHQYGTSYSTFFLALCRSSPANWSDICRPLPMPSLARFEHLLGQTMQRPRQ